MDVIRSLDLFSLLKLFSLCFLGAHRRKVRFSATGSIVVERVLRAWRHWDLLQSFRFLLSK